MNDYASFVSSRMRALDPHGQDEARAAMRTVAAEWRALKAGRGHNPANQWDDIEDNPRRRRRRRNPSSSLMPLAVALGALWLLSRRRSA